MSDLNKISHDIIQSAIEVHRELGLLLNFNVALLKDGIKRMVNDYEE